MKLILPLCFLVFAASARADVKLPAIFSDHVVLQRDRPLPVWGWAAPGEPVAVSLGAQKASATAGADGRWIVRLAAQPATKQPLTLTVAGKNTVTVSDVLLGDVWLCSGQSNMDMALGGCATPDSAQHSFSICIGDQPELDFGGKRNADGQDFAAFGRVVKGMDVVRKIQARETDGQKLRKPIPIQRIIRQN